MTKVSVYDARAGLSRLIDQALAGEEVIITRKGKPVIRLVPVEPEQKKPRELGALRGLFELPDSFFDPLPDEVLADFYGEDGLALLKEQERRLKKEQEQQRIPPDRDGVFNVQVPAAERESSLRHIRDDDPRAGHPRKWDDGQSDRPGADDQRAFAALDLRAIGGVTSDAEHFDRRELLTIQNFGFVQFDRGKHDTLAHPAVDGHFLGFPGFDIHQAQVAANFRSNFIGRNHVNQADFITFGKQRVQAILITARGKQIADDEA